MSDTFEIKEEFYHNNHPIKIVSGAIHYFRVVPEYWRDRLEKLKAMGCNTVETYVPWNMHEPKKGDFKFQGMLNIKGFIKLAQELELFVIVRPSPYICAEWEFGGLPAWLLAEDGMKVRSSYEPFLTTVDKYYNELFKIITPLQINYGGPIIMMQIENEYGYYGNDKKYLARIKDIMIKYGTVVPLVTSDGPWGQALVSGMLLEDNILPTANFGSKTEDHFPKLKAIIGNRPLMCMEFWIGWFDHWGSQHHVRDYRETAEDLDKILKEGHVNIYMFHGGTNFGFMNGSNYQDKLTPDITSYDYDAVLTEWGDITPKYEAFKKVISKYRDIPEVEFSTEISKIAYGKISVKEKVSLFNTLENISTPVHCQYTLSMEKLGQNYGYLLYRSNVKTNCKEQKFKILGGKDRAKVYVNENNILTQYDQELDILSDIVFPKEDNKFDILMENMGRVNFGEKLNYQSKGIIDGVLLDTHAQAGWSHYCLPLDNIDKIDFKADYKQNTPAFYKFEFQASKLGDTFLRFDGWGKGCAFVNGFNIGRFWEIGPQKSLYIPAPLLKIGRNEIVIFETEGKWNEYLTLEDSPDLGI
ncbi:glycoside hydrolase family 35 protein [Clostridium sp.]|jgi:beta-galactosidase|uniref:glycoside hydrolase family 35 protein n=1 Tax=Clostridium sp. TaxID=1506 RepID=UPI003EEF3F69